VQAVHLMEICLAAAGGAVAGALAYRLHARQQMALLRQRLLRSEEARNGAIERSAAAREQIGQLSKAISELRRSHQPVRSAASAVAAPPSAEERRAAAERALAQASSGQRRSAAEREDEAPLVFANTQPMTY
jgi:hypothetical protein